MRGPRRASLFLAPWVMAAAVAGTACSHPLQDLGPLPPRSSGPPIPADTVVSQLTSALAAKGIALERTSQELIAVQCQERLTGEHASATAEAALKAGFARARSVYGWEPGPDPGAGILTLRKGNWTASAQLPVGGSANSPTAPVVITVLCDGARSKSSARTDSPAPAAS